MRVDAARGRLYDAMQQLRRHWQEVDPLWTDQVRGEFEDKIGEPLNQLADEALRALERLGQIFAQARRECEGEGGCSA